MDQNLLIIASIALVGGLLVGFLLGNLKSKSAGTRARDAEAELEAYRKQVTDHFGQTAEHFQALGQQYKSLYEHLAAGADSLCETPDAGRELSFVPRGMLGQQTSELAGEAEAPEPAVPQDAVGAADELAAETQPEEPAEDLPAEPAAAAQGSKGEDEPPADKSVDQSVAQSVDQPEKQAGGDATAAPKVATDGDANGEGRPIYH